MVIQSISVHTKDNITLDNLKKFASVPFFIPWYRSEESNKVFPLFINDLSDINIANGLVPKILGKNPFFEHTDITFFTAENGNGLAGRIAAFVDDRYNSEHNEKTGWISMFECIEDKRLARTLLSRARRILKDKGCTKMVGPAKFNANGEVGLLVDGFQHKPYFMEGYNTPYYQEYFENFGFEKENDWYSIQVADVNSARINDYMSRVETLRQRAAGSSDERYRLMKETTIRNAKFKDFKKEMEIIKSLYNSEWGKGNHPQFVSMTEPEFDVLATGIKLIAIEDLILVAEHKGSPIGVAVTVPNINEVIAAYDKAHPDYLPSPKALNLKDLGRDYSIFTGIQKKLKDKSFDSLRVLILGVKEDYRKSGIDAMLYHDSFKKAIELGVKEASFSELAEINLDILRPLEKMGDRAMTWRVYSMGL
jgi:hypothetical protein